MHAPCSAQTILVGLLNASSHAADFPLITPNMGTNNKSEGGVTMLAETSSYMLQDRFVDILTRRHSRACTHESRQSCITHAERSSHSTTHVTDVDETDEWPAFWRQAPAAQSPTQVCHPPCASWFCVPAWPRWLWLAALCPDRTCRGGSEVTGSCNRVSRHQSSLTWPPSWPDSSPRESSAVSQPAHQLSTV